MAAPTHRHRSKSAPRGRSPNPKSLKKARKASAEARTSGYVTPPPRRKPEASPVDSSQSKDSLRKSISFGKNTTFHIQAENPGNNKKVQEIMDELKACPVVCHRSTSPGF